MKAMLWTAVCMGALPLGNAALAADQPPPAPTRPVAVTYSVTGPPNGPGKLSVIYDQDAKRVRMDFYRAVGSRAAEASIIFDTTNDRAVTLIPGRKAYMQRSTKGLANPGLFLSPTLTYAKQGTEHFAGLTCTDWTIKTDAAQASACVTDDGVILKATGAGKGAQNLTAIAITYGPPPVGTFSVPENYMLVTPPAQPSPAK